MPRVLLGITDLDVGGAERMLVELAIRLSQRDWQVQVFSLLPAGELAHILSQRRIPSHSLELCHIYGVWSAARRLTRIAQAFQPDLVQTYLTHANVLARLAIRGVPLISGYRVADRRRRWIDWADRLTASKAARHVCVSDGVRRYSLARLALPPERTIIIGNGVDPEPIVRAESFPFPVTDEPETANPSPRIHLVSVGRLDRQKGHDLLIAAIALVVAHRPEFRQRLQVWIAGEGPEQAALLAQIRRAGLVGTVQLLGRVANVPSLLRAADGLVLASRWEGMPNVVLEAMAAGRPVVAFRVEGVEELVLPGETGWLCPPENTEALAEAILEFCSEDDRRRQFGQAARERVTKNFTLDRMVDAYDHLYRQILRNPSPSTMESLTEAGPNP